MMAVFARNYVWRVEEIGFLESKQTLKSNLTPKCNPIHNLMCGSPEKPTPHKEAKTKNHKITKKLGAHKKANDKKLAIFI